MPRNKRPLIERFFDKVYMAWPDHCWLWTGAISKYTGYGKIGKGTRSDGTINAHQLAYILFKGNPPPGLQIDHLCRVRSCVNPDHMEAVTQKENLRRGMRWPKRHGL